MCGIIFTSILVLLSNVASTARMGRYPAVVAPRVSVLRCDQRAPYFPKIRDTVLIDIVYKFLGVVGLTSIVARSSSSHVNIFGSNFSVTRDFVLRGGQFVGEFILPVAFIS